ncbi:hypothetical protein PQX77_009237 [Marasmius sp. AFHP31]|nr:hypothetical protein PQX77_015966 [Marasmius sp. AFHP31]KAK1227766.1 hypothetical protein PQX77_009237 [Marasmius sp. AFHP31]
MEITKSLIALNILLIARPPSINNLGEGDRKINGKLGRDRYVLIDLQGSIIELMRPAFRLVSHNISRPTEDILECLVCPKSAGNYQQIARKNLPSHLETWKHKSAQKRFNGQELGSNISQSARKPEATPQGEASEQHFSVNDDVMIDDLWPPIYQKALEGEQPEEDRLADCIRALASQQLLVCEFPPVFALGETSELPDEGQEDEEDHGCEDETWNNSQVPPVTNPAYPWPSMSMFLTHVLFSGSARVRFSESQKQAVLAWGKALGAQDVPSISALKRAQESIEKMVGRPTEQVVSSSGTIFYINDVGKAIAKDFANPVTRLAMTEYPQDGGKGVSELKNRDKWLLDLPRDLLTITARVDGKIYFAGELLQCRNGGFFIPDRFFTSLKSSDSVTPPIDILYALGNTAEQTADGFVVAETKVYMSTDEFKETFEELNNAGCLACGFSECSKAFEVQMPHPRRESAKGQMVYGVPLIIFLDDVSGNISKQWNKHHAIYMSNGLLPRQMIDKEFSTKFVTSSPHAAPMELVRALRDNIEKSAQHGVDAYDCKHDEECLLIPHAHFWGSDNPMQAEECSQAGLQCNFFCRTCEVGGTQEFKRSDAGFLSIFQSGMLQTPEKTVEHIHEQIQLSTLSGAADKLAKHKAATGINVSTCANTISAIVELGKAMYAGTHPGSEHLSKEEIQRGLEEEIKRIVKNHGINPLIGMPGVDMHKDTPTEILHTVLLGIVKYFWGQTVWILGKTKGFSVFQVRLASVDTSGLNIPKLSSDYICAYKGSLIGKHFKSLAQLMPFLIYELVPRKVLDAWTIIGELVVLIWHTEIEELEEYLVHNVPVFENTADTPNMQKKLSSTIQAFLNVTAECSPLILISKPKFHFLVHLPDYIRRFGPALIFSTEQYELFNHVFHLSCIHSNRQAPSRDSCNVFATQEITKHIVTGGYWKDHIAGKWVRAGQRILQYMREDKHFRKLLALPNTAYSFSPGHARLATGQERTQRALTWTATEASKTLNADSPAFCLLVNKVFHTAVSLTTCNGDQVRIDNFAAFKYQDQTHVGCIQEILVMVTNPSDAVVVAVKRYNFSEEPHELLRMPVITPSDDFYLVDPTDIICAVNVQHDCHSGGCTSFTQAPIRQERTLTSRARLVLDHSDTALHILNTHSLHNHSIIAQLIPSPLSLILAQPAISPDDQTALRKKAAAHVRNRKAQGNKDGPDHEVLELLPFERAPARGRVRGNPSHGRPGRGHGRGQQVQDQEVQNQQVEDQQVQDQQPPAVLPADVNLESLMKFKKPQLVALCKQYGLRYSGTKTELSQRLVGLFAPQLPVPTSQPTPTVEDGGNPMMGPANVFIPDP